MSQISSSTPPISSSTPQADAQADASQADAWYSLGLGWAKAAQGMQATTHSEFWRHGGLAIAPPAW
jgi:hypothetical protein